MRRNEEDDRMNKLLAFVENEQLEAAEKKKAGQEKKRLEEEKLRMEEAKQREEAEKRRAQAIMEATAVQAFAEQMVALEEKIKDHVQSTLIASEEKNAKLHDSLRRFLERTDGEVPVWGTYGLTNFRISIEQVLITLFLLLVTVGVAPWARKVLMVTPERDDFFDLKGPAVYCLISSWCKRMYIGQTVRGEGERWWEHIRCTELGNNGHAPKLFSFLKVFDWQKYLVLPIATGTGDGLQPLQVLEKTIIHRFSPALNVVGRGTGTKRRARPGKKERQKAREVVPMHRKGLLSFALAGPARRYFSLTELLEDAIAAGVKAVRLTSSGGEVWGEKWSVVRRKFGTSTVNDGEAKFPLGRSKRRLEEGGTFKVGPIVKTESARSRGKGYLRLLLEMPGKQAELKRFDVTKFVFLYRRARKFKTKTTRRTLKEKIIAVIRKKTGVNIRLKVNVGVKYSHQLRKRKIHDTVVMCVEKSRIHPVLKAVLRRRVRVVWKKKRTVEEVLANHRKAAREATAQCTCNQDQMPRVDGHMLARIAQCSVAPVFMHKGKNILQGDIGTKTMKVQRSVGRSLETIMRRDLYQVADPSMFQEAVSDRSVARPACSEKQAREVAEKLSHLVVVPVDRNPGDLVVMCPSTYQHSLQMMFNLNLAYQQVTEKNDKEVLAHVRTEFGRLGLDKIGAWNPAAKLGQAYVLPKHKDLTRWRPIAPANAEGTKTAGRRLARALNYLLERVPKARHFNLKVMAMLKKNLEKAGRRLSIYGDDVRKPGEGLPTIR
ncbi:hypothetical protein CBR_g66674 [Chara braunii]|uniref:GIY-YIG domain-containing protein n=1 Tax=Chara braunii TaxID=69332 RepID=A0A388JQ23_CHABU|nr:hypothetical protein CBR_g66674 [Chara braunii]|eukprot:GBG59868.1 hypothetical protein CBR_g66674 [Chara braunii]